MQRSVPVHATCVHWPAPSLYPQHVLNCILVNPTKPAQPQLGCRQRCPQRTCIVPANTSVPVQKHLGQVVLQGDGGRVQAAGELFCSHQL